MLKRINESGNGFYALGLPLGASGGGDAESFVRTVILDFGGRLVDENGKVVVNSLRLLQQWNISHPYMKKDFAHQMQLHG